jgi:hypothetical protein
MASAMNDIFLGTTKLIYGVLLLFRVMGYGQVDSTWKNE